MITELTQDWENRFLEDINKTLCAPGPKEKGAVTPQETNPDLTVSVQKSLAEGWINSCLLQGQGHNSACTRPFEGGHHYLHYLHYSLASGQTTGREHSPAHQQKIG